MTFQQISNPWICRCANISYMFRNDSSVSSKQIRHLRLRQPHRLTLNRRQGGTHKEVDLSFMIIKALIMFSKSILYFVVKDCKVLI